MTVSELLAVLKDNGDKVSDARDSAYNTVYGTLRSRKDIFEKRGPGSWGLVGL